MSELKGKTAVITGASRGIGAAIAEKFSALGANVAIIYNGNREAALEVREKAQKNGVSAEVFQCDVSDSGKCRETVKAITESFGGIDILVNNAGITRDGLVLTMSEEEFDEVIDTNLRGCFNMIKACGRSFIKKKYGKIINITSVSALLGTAGQANYAASKAGVIALTKVTARELASKNVCCNAIAPGFIETDMTKELRAEEYMTSIPLKRAGKPSEVAELAAFLAGEASDYITGEVIRIDGGLAI